MKYTCNKIVPQKQKVRVSYLMTIFNEIYRRHKVVFVPAIHKQVIRWTHITELNLFFNPYVPLIFIQFPHKNTHSLLNLTEFKICIKIILTCSYMFRSTTIISESSLEPS